MKRLNVGALRRAADGAQLSAANALVQRTLAQHGLLPGGGQIDTQGMPSLDSVLAQMTGAKDTKASTAEMIPAGATFKNDTFSCGAGSRSYRTYIPASAAHGVTGVIMMLHGCTQTPEDFAAGTGMNALAEEHRLVLIYPKQARGDNAQSCWNWFSRGDQKRDRGEPAILAGIATKVSDAHGVRRGTTFVAGLSAGAAMAVILGEVYGDVFSAVGAHSGLPAGAAKDVASAFSAMAGNGSEPTIAAQTHGKVRTIIFHGTADATVHPSNGDRIGRRAISAHAPQSIETHAAEQTAGRRFSRTVSSDLDGNAIVEHWVIDGLGHAWSGGLPAGSYTDPQGPNASAEMVRFFLNKSDQET